MGGGRSFDAAEDAFLRRRQAATLTSVYPSTPPRHHQPLHGSPRRSTAGWLELLFQDTPARWTSFSTGTAIPRRSFPPRPPRADALESVFSRIRRAAGGRVQTRAVFPFDPALRGWTSCASPAPGGGGPCPCGALTAGGVYASLLAGPGRNHAPSTARTVKGRAAPLCGLTPGRRRWPRAFGHRPRHHRRPRPYGCDRGGVAQRTAGVMRCLRMPPSVESRASSLVVKRGCERRLSGLPGGTGGGFPSDARAEALSRALFGPARCTQGGRFSRGLHGAGHRGKALYYRPGASPPAAG
jgi:hypothetical protein